MLSCLCQSCELDNAVQLYVDLYRRWRGKPAIRRDFDELSILQCTRTTINDKVTAASTTTADLYGSRMFYFVRSRLTKSADQTDTPENTSKRKFEAMFAKIAALIPTKSPRRARNSPRSPASHPLISIAGEATTEVAAVRSQSPRDRARSEAMEWDDTDGEAALADNVTVSGHNADASVPGSPRTSKTKFELSELTQEFVSTLVAHLTSKMKEKPFVEFVTTDEPGSMQSAVGGGGRVKLVSLRSLDTEFCQMLLQDPRAYSKKKAQQDALDEDDFDWLSANPAQAEAQAVHFAALLRLCVEDILIRPRTRPLWAEMAVQYQAEDAEIVAAMHANRGKPQAFWGISQPSAANWANSVAFLNRVEDTQLPTAKLFFVQQAINAIFAEMRGGPNSRSPTRQVLLSGSAAAACAGGRRQVSGLLLCVAFFVVGAAGASQAPWIR